MTMRFNGTELEEVRFNGVDCDKVYFNGELVFEKVMGSMLTIGNLDDGEALSYGMRHQDYPNEPTSYGYLSPQEINGIRLNGFEWNHLYSGGDYFYITISLSDYHDLPSGFNPFPHGAKYRIEIGDIIIEGLNEVNYSMLFMDITEQEFNSLPKGGTVPVTFKQIS